MPRFFASRPKQWGSRPPARVRPTLAEFRVAMINNFESISQFAEAHQDATDFEFKQQTGPIRAHNESKHIFDAWVIAAPPDEDASLGFIFRVAIESDDSIGGLLPDIGDQCEIQLVGNGGNTSRWYYSERTNRLQLVGSLNRYPEFKVLDIADSWSKDLKPAFVDGDDLSQPPSTSQSATKVRVRLHLSETTYNAETGALENLLKSPSEKQQLAFEYLVLLKDPTHHVGLHDEFPHIFDKWQIADEQLRSRLGEMVQELDDDQKSAFQKLGQIPEGVFFLPGTAGSGKTKWCLSVAALAQGAEPSAKVLYLLDINKPLDDTASKMVRLYRELGLNKKVIRMLKWPREMKKNSISNTGAKTTNNESAEKEADPKESFEPDFRWSFLDQWKLAEAASQGNPKDDFRAPTLDEAACQYFFDNRGTKDFTAIEAFLNIASTKPSEWCDGCKGIFERSRVEIEAIYREVLEDADFIATTPVAAFCHFNGMFSPDLIFFDESAHARELSTLIPISYFEPDAWFFVGDWRQMSPYVGSNSLMCAQLHLSLLERMNRKVHVSWQLCTNHRALGGLEKLPSTLFYNSEMISPHSDESKFPESLKHLRDYFLSFMGTEPRTPKSAIPRFMVDCGTISKEEQHFKSFWSPYHQKWVMKRVYELLDDPAFTQPNSSEPGTILIVSPYGEACQRYRSAVERIYVPEKRLRVEARTLGTSQGAEADVVFVDMVKQRSSEFSNDAKRLCVALTRARQAEVIMMASGMALSGKNSDNLFAIYQGCQSGEHGTSMRILKGLEKPKQEQDNTVEESEEYSGRATEDKSENSSKELESNENDETPQDRDRCEQVPE